MHAIPSVEKGHKCVKWSVTVRFGTRTNRAGLCDACEGKGGNGNRLVIGTGTGCPTGFDWLSHRF